MITALNILRRIGRGLFTMGPRPAALCCAMLVLGGIFWPLWRIELYAPQYPEGLTLLIWMNRLSGDLDNMNVLNHYIGMRHINAASFPELAYLPKILYLLSGLAMLAAWVNRRWILALWDALFIGLGALGMYDMYRWGYDFGHNLDPNAPIQMPGMSYQPPLFGSKVLINITSYSLPDLAGILLAAAAFIGLWPFLSALVLRIGQGIVARITKKPTMALLMIGGMLMSGCLRREPTPIVLGRDTCAECKMTIRDGRFGAIS